MTPEDFNPLALASTGDITMDERPGVQEVNEYMIARHVIATNELPPYSALPFSVWANESWEDFNTEGECTNGDVLSSTLHDWRGGRT